MNIVEASIGDLQHALTTGSVTSVELVTKYLQRIVTYDTRGPCLNSIVLFNPRVYDEAAASDARRMSGQVVGPLDGIPYTLKDSMMYVGMTCATGSPAFKDLQASRDSFVGQQLRKAGAVLIGKTNTPPMMASGMHRGLFGRAESPYNLDYLTAAFSSGSSNGSATSTAASFAAFGLGSETVSSGRSPASNNGLVAYTPSRTVISPRGIWPLYPTCDVVVPHTRTVADMLAVLDVLTTEDAITEGDFWRQQKFVDVPRVDRPQSWSTLKEGSTNSLQGKRVAVPAMYIGGKIANAKPVTTSPEVLELWKQARLDLEALGATVIETDFPLVTKYEDDSASGHANNVEGFKPGWNSVERGELVAYLWDDFLKANGDPGCPDLSSVDGSQMFPARPEGYLPDRWLETKNFIHYPSLVELARKRHGKSIWSIDGIAEALPALEAGRKRDLEDWMDANGIDLVVFPANGDVGKADLESNGESARHALQNGVKYSNGNRAIRHFGVPTVSVTMGLLSKSCMPVNLTFAGKHGQDSDLLRYAYAFEQRTKRRIMPPVTPALTSDHLDLGRKEMNPSSHRPQLSLSMVAARRSEPEKASVSGEVQGQLDDDDLVHVSLYVKHADKDMSLPSVELDGVKGRWNVDVDIVEFMPSRPMYGGYGEGVEKVVIVVMAKSKAGIAGKLMLLE
ncbi:hypothetical protein LTR78_001679 [Recurvomyces mirabilis]|uniref:Amidase domain-containing protein n=1 Tax=Recurvomyces mirabilis TaxID=574656 RepID=A0AAE0WUW5_9PEZI|nr:hypothetical protein LTR78_001679 [Recurvomyces mirabilis]KAK5151751.1 hypothetical protein LTS14_008883 [Recurvomyces mirabilis]